MDIKKIPLIIPVFNQLSYLRNLINWWNFFYPDNLIYVVNNGSTYVPLNNFLKGFWRGKTNPIMCKNNEFIPNLTAVIQDLKNKGLIEDYYVISDPDIMPHPATPGNFLETMVAAIEEGGYHRAGFQLITENITAHNRATILENENSLRNNPTTFNGYPAHIAPIDTTFCLYSTKNSGWHAPMNGRDWGNCLRIFEAFHLPWHLDENNIPEEMKQYFSSCKKHVPHTPSAGSNNYRPQNF